MATERVLPLDERRLRSRSRYRLPPAALLAALLGLALVLAAPPSSAAAQTPAWVDTGGDCLRMRTAPGLEGPDLVCLEHGAAIMLLDGVQQLDGFAWREIAHDGRTGWIAEFYTTTDPSEVQPLWEPADAEASAGDDVPAPPPGGLTFGIAAETDPAALVAAQPYAVVSLWHFDLESQQLLRFIPGAPAHVNTLSELAPESVVMLRRAGEPSALTGPPEAALTVAGTPNVLAEPPVGGLTQGVAGTTDPRFLVQAQPFTVESVAYFHVGSQTWLTYLPGAPDEANSLRQGQLRLDSIVTVRRGPDGPETRASDDGSGRFETSITYYYCVPGANPASIGDAGGYCGAMANGERVHEGAAACAPRHLGQRFRIEGDPTARTYTCTDTGGSVLRDHRDIWFMNSDDGYAWWQTVGERAFVQILAD